MIRSVALPSGETVPQLGQGTWRMGERPAARSEETRALRRGIELGMTLVDTAEMYGDGDTEAWLGEALAGLREQLFLVSKAYPQNASRERLQPVFAAVYGEAGATVWWTRWRLFFLSVEELFAHDGGGQWWVSHYLFERR